MTDEDVLIQDAVNVLGNPTDINLTGSRAFGAEASPTGLPASPSMERGGAGVGAEATGPMGGEAAPGPTGPAGDTGGAGPDGNPLQKALTAMNLANATFGAANKLQALPGREGNAFNLASTGLQDLGFSLGGGLAQGFVDTPIGALSQQDYQGILDAFRSGTEAPSGAADLLSQGGFTLGGGAEAAAGAGGGGLSAAGIGGGVALAAIPVIMAALRAAGVEIPQSVAQGVSTAGLTAGAIGSASGVLPAAGAATGIGVAAAPIVAAILGETMHRLEPSEEWQSFPGRLSKSLSLENAAAQHFGNQLLGGGIQNRQQLADMIGQYKATLGYGPETFESGTFSHSLGPEYLNYLNTLSDPFGLPNLPGATGEAHEGGQVVDFNPMQTALNDIVQSYLAHLPAGEAGLGTMTPWTLQEIGLNRHPMFYNPFWNQEAGQPESAGGG